MSHEELLKMPFTRLIWYRTQQWNICQGKPWESRKKEIAWKEHTKANTLIKKIRENITTEQEMEWEFLPTVDVMIKAGIL